jgi:hypothetical protein
MTFAMILAEIAARHRARLALLDAAEQRLAVSRREHLEAVVRAFVRGKSSGEPT